jgi:molybdate transport system permease protein
MKTASKSIGIGLILVGAIGIVGTTAMSFTYKLDVTSSILASIFASTLFCFLPAALFLRHARTRLGEPFLPMDWVFYLSLWILGSAYLVLIVALLIADLSFTTPAQLLESLRSPEDDTLVGPQIRYAIILSMISCSVTAILSLWIGVPLGYLLARTQFWGKTLVDTLLDIPIVLPPLVIGLSLLILFQTRVGRLFEESFFTVTYAVPSVILAQFTVAAAFAVRTMRVTFEQISPRTEQVAMTLGCTRAQAFWRVVLPEAWRGVLTAGTLSWARSLGEFGPILIFSGATRMRTEVLPTTVFLELSVGRIEAAIAVSLLMIAAAVVVLILTRTFGLRGTGVV